MTRAAFFLLQPASDSYTYFFFSFLVLLSRSTFTIGLIYLLFALSLFFGMRFFSVSLFRFLSDSFGYFFSLGFFLLFFCSARISRFVCFYSEKTLIATMDLLLRFRVLVLIVVVVMLVVFRQISCTKLQAIILITPRRSSNTIAKRISSFRLVTHSSCDGWSVLRRRRRRRARVC